MMFLLLLLVAYTTSMQPPKHFDLKDNNYIQNLYKEYVQEHGKVYSPDEYTRRLEIFKQSLKDSNERNAKFPQVEYGYDRFSDLTEEEKRRNFGSLPVNETLEELATLNYSPEEITAPEHWDWREHGAVTHVKDQGDCGSCWIFSAIGHIEGQYAIKYKELLAFSEQQSVDCIPPFWDDTCDGGLPDMCMFHYVGWQGWGSTSCPLELEKEYPYHGKKETCLQWQPRKKLIAQVESVNVFKTDEESLKQILYETGPISTDLDMADLFSYKKGIIHPNKCHHSRDHAVLLVGYGTENGTKYWTVKNSFGKNWGEDGYFRLLRGVGACDFGTEYVATATVKKFTPRN